ncbi:Immunoglobulin lambda variable 1-40 [Plecturocebus cupreus]
MRSLIAFQETSLETKLPSSLRGLSQTFLASEYKEGKGQIDIGKTLLQLWGKKAGLRAISRMAWPPLLLTLFIPCTDDWTWGKGRGPGKPMESIITMSVSFPVLGPWAPSLLIQSLSVPEALGQRLTTSCTGNSSTFGCWHNVHWFQKLPGTTPKLLIYKTAGSKSGNSIFLIIVVLQPDDDTDYHCQFYKHSLSACTMIQVEEREAKICCVSSHATFPSTPYSAAKSMSSFTCCPKTGA